MGECFRLEFRDSVFALVGELDIASVDSFETQVATRLNDVASVVALDLSELSFVDATGLSSFVKLERQLRDGHRVLVLRNPRPNVQRALDVTGLTSLLERSVEDGGRKLST